jgi:hypothetical protein
MSMTEKSQEVEISTLTDIDQRMADLLRWSHAADVSSLGATDQMASNAQYLVARRACELFDAFRQQALAMTPKTLKEGRIVLEAALSVLGDSTGNDMTQRDRDAINEKVIAGLSSCIAVLKAEEDQADQRSSKRAAAFETPRGSSSVGQR